PSCRRRRQGAAGRPVAWLATEVSAGSAGVDCLPIHTASTIFTALSCTVTVYAAPSNDLGPPDQPSPLRTRSAIPPLPGVFATSPNDFAFAGSAKVTTASATATG